MAGRFGGKGDNSRMLTTDEIKLLKRVFRTARLPRFDEVTIADGVNANGGAWTDSDYEINVGPSSFNQDLSSVFLAATLVHEMTHVWQYYNHTLTKAHGFVAHLHAGATDWVQKKLDRVLPGHWEDGEADNRLYKYDLDGSWEDMGFEGQAQMVEDWYDMGMKEEGYRYFFMKHIVWAGDPAAMTMTRTELAMRSPDITGAQDMYIGDKAVAHEARVPLTDSYLISLLQPRYAPDDVAGFGARAKKVEQVFQSTSVAQALPLFGRLVSRRAGDKVSTYFHDHLSTPTRAKLLQILQNRTAGK
jgi:hypothetical protein